MARWPGSRIPDRLRGGRPQRKSVRHVRDRPRQVKHAVAARPGEVHHRVHRDAHGVDVRRLDLLVEARERVLLARLAVDPQLDRPGHAPEPGDLVRHPVREAAGDEVAVDVPGRGPVAHLVDARAARAAERGEHVVVRRRGQPPHVGLGHLDHVEVAREVELARRQQHVEHELRVRRRLRARGPVHVEAVGEVDAELAVQQVAVRLHDAPDLGIGKREGRGVLEADDRPLAVQVVVRVVAALVGAGPRRNVAGLPAVRVRVGEHEHLAAQLVDLRRIAGSG